MFTITARIYTINIISEKKIQIILKKQVNGKQVLIAIELFGRWKYEADKLNLKKGDKITGIVYIKSNLYKGRFYNDIYFENISLIPDKTKKHTIKEETDMFFSSNNHLIPINEETGKPYF